MDLFENFSKTYRTLKDNLLLFLPPLVIAYLVPVALFVSAAYIFIPIFAQTSLTGSASVVLFGAFVSAAILILVAFALYASVFAGWGYLNKAALKTELVSFGKFREGVTRYFARVFAATIIIAGGLTGIVVAAFLSIEAIGGKLGAFSPTAARLILLVRKALTTGQLGNILPANPQALIESLTKFAVGVSATVLFFVTIAGLWILFTAFWIPAIIVSDLRIFEGLSKSISFVRENLFTVMGLAGLWIIADRFVGTIFPGSTGIVKGTVIVNPSALGGVFHILIQAFFVLFLYCVYLDRVHTGTA